MVDEALPLKADPRPLRYAFLDLNAYFASVEQQERPRCIGRRAREMQLQRLPAQRQVRPLADLPRMRIGECAPGRAARGEDGREGERRK